jgi:hypothetical protein
MKSKSESYSQFNIGDKVKLIKDTTFYNSFDETEFELKSGTILEVDSEEWSSSCDDHEVKITLTCTHDTLGDIDLSILVKEEDELLALHQRCLDDL